MCCVCFNTPTGAVQVPRSRFAPVKTNNDLLVLRSDVYKIEEDATVQLARPMGQVSSDETKKMMVPRNVFCATSRRNAMLQLRHVRGQCEHLYL